MSAKYQTRCEDDIELKIDGAQEFVCFNVGGMFFETLRSTLDRYPDTLLGNEQRCQQFFVPSKNSYFFDRHRSCFEAILYYYQSNGVLVRPLQIPGSVFDEEIDFFDLLPNEAVTHVGAGSQNSGETFLQKVWEFFDRPEASVGARILACFSIAAIVLSVIAFCAETVPSGKNNSTEFRQQQQQQQQQRAGDQWQIVELCCVVWFSLEYVIRIVSSPNKKKFLRSFLNLVDLLAIVPYYISAAVSSSDTNEAVSLSAVRAVRLLRVSRVLRVLKLSRHSEALQILGLTLRASLHEIAMVSFFIFVSVILFSSGIFYAEYGHNDVQFSSVPATFWFTITSMNTVGYGDLIPVTFVGRVLGTLCTVCGVLSVTLPMPAIMTNFRHIYREMAGKGDVTERKKEEESFKIIA